MPANFTEEQRKVIRNSLLTIGYDLIREVGLKKMKVSLIAERAEIATGTFHWKWFFIGLVSILPLALIIGGIVALIGVIV